MFLNSVATQNAMVSGNCGKLPPFVFGTPTRIHATEATGGPAKVAKITGWSFINERDHDWSTYPPPEKGLLTVGFP